MNKIGEDCPEKAIGKNDSNKYLNQKYSFCNDLMEAKCLLFYYIGNHKFLGFVKARGRKSSDQVIYKDIHILYNGIEL